MNYEQEPTLTEFDIKEIDRLKKFNLPVGIAGTVLTPILVSEAFMADNNAWTLIYLCSALGSGLMSVISFRAHARSKKSHMQNQNQR